LRTTAKRILLASIAPASGFASPAWSIPKPMALEATFSNTVSSDVKASTKAPRCPVTIVALADVRRSPEMIGIYERRPVYAPQDRDAWLKSIVQALGSRGLDPRFEKSPSSAAAVKLDLKTAWITNTNANVSASVVFTLRVTKANGEVTEASYRGGNSRMPYWGTGPSLVQKAMDVAFARVLDQMAAELLKTCPA